MAELASPAATLSVSEPGPGRLVVVMAGEYDIASIQHLSVELDALLQRDAKSVSLDMTELTFMDTSGVAVLLRIANHFGPIEVRGANPIIRRTIQALGLSERLRMPG
jgi:anti-sigma B factor antagonist